MKMNPACPSSCGGEDCCCCELGREVMEDRLADAERDPLEEDEDLEPGESFYDLEPWTDYENDTPFGQSLADGADEG